MDIAQVMQDFNTISSMIQEKQDKVMSEIEKITNFIKNAKTELVGQSEEFIQRKIDMAKAKIEKLKQKILDWVNEQLKKAQEWLDSIKQKIEEQLQRMILKIAQAALGL